MGKRSGGDQQKRGHGKAVKAARQARRDELERRMREDARPVRVWIWSGKLR